MNTTEHGQAGKKVGKNSIYIHTVENMRTKRVSNCTTSSSRADSHNYCAQYEESMKSLGVLVHTISFNFRCGGKLNLTSEVGHLGFYKMAAVKSLFSKSLLLIDLEF